MKIHGVGSGREMKRMSGLSSNECREVDVERAHWLRREGGQGMKLRMRVGVEIGIGARRSRTATRSKVKVQSHASTVERQTSVKLRREEKRRGEEESEKKEEHCNISFLSITIIPHLY